MADQAIDYDAIIRANGGVDGPPVAPFAARPAKPKEIDYDAIIRANGGVDANKGPGVVERTLSGVGRGLKALNPVTIANDLAQAAAPKKPGDMVWDAALGPGIAPAFRVAKGMVESHGALGNRGIEELKSGQYATGARHLVESAIPGLGPGMSPMGDRAASGDVAGALGEAGVFAATTALTPKVPQVAEGIANVATKVPAALERSAAQNYLRVLLPGSKRVVARAEETAAAMAKKKPMAWTREGLIEKAQTEKALAGPKAGEAYANKPDLPASRIQPIRDEIQRLRERHVQVKGSGVEVNHQLRKSLDDLEGTLDSLEKNAYGSIAAETLDDFRDKLFRGVVDATGSVRNSAPATAKSIEKGVANATRRVLDDAYPSSKALNDNYKLWASAVDFLEDARRRTISARSGIATGSSTGFGASVQRMMPRPIREIPARVAGIFDSVVWNTVTGAAKQKIAEFLANGKWGEAAALMRADYAGQPPPAGLLPPGRASFNAPPIPDPSFVRGVPAQAPYAEGRLLGPATTRLSGPVPPPPEAPIAVPAKRVQGGYVDPRTGRQGVQYLSDPKQLNSPLRESPQPLASQPIASPRQPPPASPNPVGAPTTTALRPAPMNEGDAIRSFGGGVKEGGFAMIQKELARAGEITYGKPGAIALIKSDPRMIWRANPDGTITLTGIKEVPPSLASPGPVQ